MPLSFGMRLPAARPVHEQRVALGVAVHVLVGRVRPLEPVQRRLGQVDVAELDERAHVAEQQRQQQRRDVLAVDVGIGHEHDLVVPGLVGVEVLADAGAERRDHGLHLVVAEGPVEARLLDVEDLAAQRQDRLRLGVAALDGRTAGRVALDDEDLGERRVFARAVLAACRACRSTRAAPLRRVCSRALRAAMRACDAWMRLADDVGGLRGLRSNQSVSWSKATFCTNAFASVLPSLVFVWPSNCGSPSLIEMTAVRPSRTSSPVRLSSFSLSSCSSVLRVAVDQRGQRRAEPLFVRAALVRVDRVRVGVDALVVSGVPLHGDLERDLAARCPRCSKAMMSSWTVSTFFTG